MTSSSEITPLLLAPNAAAKALGISRSTAYAWMRDGVLPWVQFGADRRIPFAEVQRLAVEGIPRKDARRAELI
ncbi:helix-turn-helix domain-containing protein [Pseudomonas sp. FW300-N2A2]|uniref:helix-turn-helix domain-containing protein n=1 Tax=Pseudomonas sp. FW300-N2A2 TaxID=2751316 RepID=UPI001A92596F|nr:helix-turn-helix domain-containing protein [Pseudomonas sp. FW300-N2A2]